MTAEHAVYDLQRRMNLLLAQVEPDEAPAPAVLAELAELQARVAAARPKPEDVPRDGGMLMGALTTGLEAGVELAMAQIPTSFVHVMNEKKTPLVTYALKNSAKKIARVRVSTQVVGYSAEAISTLELAGGEDVPLAHLPVFDHERIAGITEARAACVRVRIDHLDGQVELEQTFRAVLLPRTSSYLDVEDGKGGFIDLKPYLAAWVTPNAAAVMSLVREAAGLHPEKTIVGYQPRNAADLPDRVREQVKAIYGAIQKRGVVYVNSVTAFNQAGDTFVQRVRLPRESLADRSANCIDGVVLMASALEAASLNAAIVTVPGHAYVAYETRPDADSWEYVETTMVGKAPFEDAVKAARERHEEVAKTRSAAQKLYKLVELRTKHGIFPME